MILELGVSLLAVAGFGLALWRCRVVPVARRAVTATLAGISPMLDNELDDDAKEAAVRRAGIELIVISFSILWRLLVVLIIAALPIYVADGINLVSSDSVFRLMLRWDYIAIVSVIAVITSEYFRRSRNRNKEMSVAVNRNSMADRFVHAIAFSSPMVLKTAAALEERLVRDSLCELPKPPIFVTSLARGGTTALLNALHDVPGIATHIYRDMPFLTAPNLWNRLAGGDKRGVERHQRAHGDGLEIDLDSPEAFEEVLWKMYWPEKYGRDSIELWGPQDRKPEAEQIIAQHMVKIIYARAAQADKNGIKPSRYCSKNNAHIARISYLSEAFPGCRIVVPVRRPECHAASLLRQHLNFLALQAKDEFIERYMRDIGHFEFGQIFKPFDFPGFDVNRFEPKEHNFWLNYWVHTFGYILEHQENCIFVLQDELRASPEKTMAALCELLEISPGSSEFATYFRADADESSVEPYDRKLFSQANALYRKVANVAITN